MKKSTGSDTPAPRNRATVLLPLLLLPPSDAVRDEETLNLFASQRD